jgi:hypothetical protein
MIWLPPYTPSPLSCTGKKAIKLLDVPSRITSLIFKKYNSNVEIYPYVFSHSIE